jgi:hypothetical protein
MRSVLALVVTALAACGAPGPGPQPAETLETKHPPREPEKAQTPANVSPPGCQGCARSGPPGERRCESAEDGPCGDRSVGSCMTYRACAPRCCG